MTPDLQRGTRLVKVGGRDRSTIVARSEVQRFTPTGIICLTNGDKLDPNPGGDGGFTERGARVASPWATLSRWYREDSKTVASATAADETRRIHAAVHHAYDAWVSSKDDPRRAAALRDAATALTDHYAEGDEQ